MDKFGYLNFFLYNGKRLILSFYNVQGTEQTMALSLSGSQRLKFEVQNFINMPNLHYLIFPNGCNLIGNLENISKRLRWLQWRNIPFAYILMELNLFYLTLLDFSRSSNLASLWIDSNISLEVNFICKF